MRNRLIYCLALMLLLGGAPLVAGPYGDDVTISTPVQGQAVGTKAAVTPVTASSQTLKSVYAAPKLAAIAPKATLDQVFNALNKNETDVMARVRFVPFNDDALYTRWKMISDAKETIDCTYYIIDKDIFGQAYLGLLVKKAREGVKIRLMIDGRIYRSGYMKGMNDLFQELAAFPTVQIKIYNSITQSLLHAFTEFTGLFASNHDKIIIADGKYSITGGRNIGPDYFAGKGEYSCVYRDTDILIEGAYVASRMKMAFDAEWKSLRNSVVKPDWYNWTKQLDRLEIAEQVMDRYLRGKGVSDPAKTNLTAKQKVILAELNAEILKFKNLSSLEGFELFTNEPERPVKIIDKYSSLGKMNDITPCLVGLIDAAQKEVIIQNPYVVLTDQAWQALRRASARKVKIIFHSNSGASTDSLFPQAFLMSDWKQMLADMPTCHIYVAPSENERLHSKTFVIDGKITIIGSYNMDPLSQDSNSELVAVVNDEGFSQEVRTQILEKDMAKVIEYTIRVGKDGKIEKVSGPEDHLTAKMIKKMDFYRKLKWIRPVI